MITVQHRLATSQPQVARLLRVTARAWGSEFVRLQNAGHINTQSGHGEWPLGMALLMTLTAPDAARSPRPRASSGHAPAVDRV